ncbi:MAG TPA: NAD-dependent epimerase/dehydratase family protein [Nitrosopumilus sp.]|nr:NAD-dependent epimerase/dehydratase family protein [Nitrosopumilus sp.]
MDRKVVVTGVAGLIGSHVANELLSLKLFKVIGIDDLSGGMEENLKPLIKKGMKFYKMDLRDTKKLKRILNSVETVYHLAAHAAEIKSLYNPIDDQSNNLGSFHSLMIACVYNQVRKVVFTSSMSVYGTQDQMPYTEEQECHPEDFYGITKYAVEQSLPIYQKVYGINYTIVRCHNVYGPGQNIGDPYRNVLAIWANMILRGKKPLVYGDGEQLRSFTHVDDCKNFIIECGYKFNGETFNIGNEEPISIKKACQLLCDAMGWEKGFEYAPRRPQEVKHAWSSSMKAVRTGYDWKVNFKAGISDFCHWILEHKPMKPKYDKQFEIEKNIPKQWKEKMI